MGIQPSPSPIFGPFLLRPNGWIHQNATWYRGRPHPRGLCVRWRPSLPPQKGGGAPKFSAHVYCGQTAAWIKMPIGTVVGLSPGDFVLDGDPATPRRKDTPIPTQFLAHVYCGQTAAGWMKTPLGAEVDLGTGHIVGLLDVVPIVRERGSPLFWPMYGHGRPSLLLLSSCLPRPRRDGDPRRTYSMVCSR